MASASLGCRVVFTSPGPEVPALTATLAQSRRMFQNRWAHMNVHMMSSGQGRSAPRREALQGSNGLARQHGLAPPGGQPSQEGSGLGVADALQGLHDSGLSYFLGRQ